MLLEVSALTKRFGGVVAVNAVDLAIPEGRVFGLIGPNGAGKTTLINLISGHFRADGGAIRFADADVTGQRPDQLARRGIARTFQSIRLFKGLTVLENVLVGRYVRARSDVLASLVPFRDPAAAERERSQAILERFGLAERGQALAGELAYGD